MISENPSLIEVLEATGWYDRGVENLIDKEGV
jgi:hypothetical protein